jgi:hypothetical protein
MTSHIELRAYHVGPRESIKRIDPDALVDALPDGSMVVIHPNEPYRWSYIPACPKPDDDDDRFGS